jgi:hypothetical protein
MATLDYTGSAVAGAAPPETFSGHAYYAPLYRRLAVADIIAADTTMTTNGYIAADDVVQAIHVTNGYSLDYAVLRIITAGTATVACDVGLAGGSELIAAAQGLMDATAGTCYRTLEAQSYDLGHVFTANDTIDVEYTVANCLIGDSELFIFGSQLVLGS